MTTNNKDHNLTKKEMIQYAEKMGCTINPKDSIKIIRQECIDFLWKQISLIGK